MMEHQFADAYQVLRAEESVFCTAINLFGIRVDVVHTKLDLSLRALSGGRAVLVLAKTALRLRLEILIRKPRRRACQPAVDECFFQGLLEDLV